jgi:hypothetical protein
MSGSSRSRNPSTWEQYERGGSPGRGSVSSNGGRSVAFDDEYLDHTSSAGPDDRGLTNARRRRYDRNLHTEHALLEQTALKTSRTADLP